MDSLKGKTIFITGASRGIGKAIGLRAARDGANIVVAAKTAEPHPKLDGTVHTAVKELEAAGGRALACITDIRFEDQVQAAVDKAVEMFGGIDILVNNASAIHLSGTIDTPMKRYDLMHGDQHARHVSDLEVLPAAPAQGSQPAHPQYLAAAFNGAAAGSRLTWHTRWPSTA